MNLKTNYQVNSKRENIHSLHLIKQSLESGQSMVFYSKGSSMKPIIFPGWGLYVEPFEKVGLNVGDIAIYKQEEETITAHRILRKIFNNKDDIVFYFKGDNVDFIEGPIKKEAVLGKVTKIISPWFTFSPNGLIIKLLYPLLRFLYYSASGIKHKFN